MNSIFNFRSSVAFVLFSLFSIMLARGQAAPFLLHNGDRVVFYGDSITEQQYYTRFVELYTQTRFPTQNVTFIMSGVSGDKVSGGGGGPIDQRLPRDVSALKPTIVTIMLGMNDGYYRAYDPGILRTYELGYAHILDEIRAHNPQARVVVLRPSPYDEITQPGKGIEGYNSVLIKMGDSISQMATARHLDVVDLNAPVVRALTTASTGETPLVPMLIADHVHPGPGIHWVMADAILKSWNAPAIVTSVSLDASNGTALDSDNCSVTNEKSISQSLSWLQLDKALPLPFPAAATDPVTALALHSSTVVSDLDQEILKVEHLRPGRYELSIDDDVVATLSSDDLAKGVNLATLETPMLQQSQLVYLANENRASLDTTRNHLIRNAPSPANDKLLEAVNAALEDATKEQRHLAQPKSHRYSIRPVQ